MYKNYFMNFYKKLLTIFFITLISPCYALSETAIVKNISFDNKQNIEILIDKKSDFKVYNLHNPERLVVDIADNKKVLLKQISMYEERYLKYDSLTDLLNQPIIKERNNTYYYLGRLATKDEVFPNNTRTLEQLKSTGAFRFIKKPTVVNDILAYYAIVPAIRQYEEIEVQETNKYRKLAVDIFVVAAAGKGKFICPFLIARTVPSAQLKSDVIFSLNS